MKKTNALLIAIAVLGLNMQTAHAAIKDNGGAEPCPYLSQSGDAHNRPKFLLKDQRADSTGSKAPKGAPVAGKSSAT